MANEPLTKERRKEGITTITAKKLIARQAPLLSYDLITSPDRTMTPRYIVLCTGYSTAGIKQSLVEIYGFLPVIADGTPLKSRGTSTMKTVFVDLRRPYQIPVMVPALWISNHLLRASLICLT